MRVIINTHGDGDHVGGNAVLGRNATIIAHPAVRTQMSGYFALPAAETEGLPTVTVEEETTLYFNDEVIKLLPVPGRHTAGDMVVHFTKRRSRSSGSTGRPFPKASTRRTASVKRSWVRARLSRPSGTTSVPSS